MEHRDETISTPEENPRTMPAGRLTLNPRRFAVEEVPVPRPGPGEVLVAVKASGVCLSDIHLIDGSLTPPFNKNDAVTLGHETAGVIEEIGPGVTGWTVGTRVALQAGQACGLCPACLQRKPCPEVRTRGVDYDGGWAEFTIARADTLVAIPDNLPFDQAAIIPDAVSTPYSAIVDTGQLRPGQAVGIWGIGGLGAHGVRICRMAGAYPIIALDPVPSARERALSFGADLALDPSSPSVAEEVRAATGGRGLDLAFDFAGVPAVREQAAALLGLSGVLVLVGLTPHPLTVPDGIGFSVKGNQLRGHYGSSDGSVEQLIALSSGGRLDLAPSITAHIPLAEAAEAVSQLQRKVGDPIRLILVP
ncbi:zinc-binding dehydrogenase [Aeromicrobium wangtongii]|uniref:zinc-binding dehydrogenase n=1 Tax=Aeromicrobium wangtongii TaxID=2969247 RepID=UPI002017B55C|nr:zinc-binding dehydrogenase [Aeromicrobium wangtongii]MCL3819361.1 zinc-binding dehydrogenase [Aeromicrobium wangtongii]